MHEHAKKDTAPEPQSEADALYEKDFRRKSIHHSFMGALYGAVGGAAFIGVLSSIVGLAIGTLSISGIGLPVAIALMASFMAVGAVSLFFAQREYTEVGCLNNDRLARQSAKAMGHASEIAGAAAAQNKKPIVPGLTFSEAPERRFSDTIKPGVSDEKGFAQSELARREEASLAAGPAR